MTDSGRRRGEFALIAELFAPLGGNDVRSLALRDDAAVLPQTAGRDTVVTTDTMVCGVHFLDIETPDIVARRLMRVNLSDLASMGAEPTACFLNLTLSDDIDDAWLEAFAAGFRADQDAFGMTLIGGDTTHTPGPLTLSLTAMGEVPTGAAVTRGGAQPGDVVMVSGTIGDAALGLRVLTGERAADDDLLRRYQLPEPRLALGRALRGIATAMADVSDGLAADLGHICEASGRGARIDAADVPLSGAVGRALDAGETDYAAILAGGDDYELVFAVPPGRRDDADRAAAAVGVAVTAIGEIGGDAAGAVRVTGRDGAEIALQKAGYTHF